MSELMQGYPLGAFRFQLSIPGVDKAFAAFSYCSGFSYQQKSLPVRFGDDKPLTVNVVPYSGEYSKITFKRGVIQDVDLFNFALRAQTDFKPAPGNKAFSKGKDLILTVFKDDGKPGMRWVFHNSTLSSYELGAMDALRNEILIESYTFAFADGVDRVIPLDKEEK